MGTNMMVLTRDPIWRQDSTNDVNDEKDGLTREVIEVPSVLAVFSMQVPSHPFITHRVSRSGCTIAALDRFEMTIPGEVQYLKPVTNPIDDCPPLPTLSSPLLLRYQEDYHIYWLHGKYQSFLHLTLSITELGSLVKPSFPFRATKSQSWNGRG